MKSTGEALATTDGRWAAVSTATTLVVAGAVAWMAMGVMPVSRPMVAPGRASLPYALFQRLMHAGEPATAPDNADKANPEPGVESRTVTLDAGDTLVGMLEDVGPRLRGGAVVIARTVRVDGTGEGVLAAPLEAIAKAHPALSLGSYPFWDPTNLKTGFGSNLVVRGRDPAEVAAAVDALVAALEALGIANVRSLDGGGGQG